MAPVRCPSKLHTVVVTSPIGDIEVKGCNAGLHSVKQCDADDSTFSPDERIPVGPKTVELSPICGPIDECVKWLKKYFTDRDADVKIPEICSSVIQNDSFRGKAQILLPVAAPLGSTISYKDLACLCGNSAASRAAGGAMANNPISFLIPCHRVISSQGKTGNYSHGKKNKIKEWLLAFECEKMLDGRKREKKNY